MPVRNGVLCRLVSAGALVASAIGTVPATDTWLVKSVFVWNQSGGVTTPTVYATDASQTVIALLFSGALNANTGANVSIPIALAPGDSVRVTIAVANVSVWVSGADLPGHL